MRNSTKQDQRVAEEFSKYRLAAPSPGLQDRVLQSASQAMREKGPELDDIPWKFPVFRFAVCLVIAAFLIVAANSAGDYIAAQGKTSLASIDRPDANTISAAGLADAPLMVRLSASDPARLRRVAQEQFLNYWRQVQELPDGDQ